MKGNFATKWSRYYETRVYDPVYCQFWYPLGVEKAWTTPFFVALRGQNKNPDEHPWPFHVGVPPGDSRRYTRPRGTPGVIQLVKELRWLVRHFFFLTDGWEAMSFFWGAAVVLTITRNINSNKKKRAWRVTSVCRECCQHSWHVEGRDLERRHNRSRVLWAGQPQRQKTIITHSRVHRSKRDSRITFLPRVHSSLPCHASCSARVPRYEEQPTHHRGTVGQDVRWPDHTAESCVSAGDIKFWDHALMLSSLTFWLAVLCRPLFPVLADLLAFPEVQWCRVQLTSRGFARCFHASLCCCSARVSCELNSSWKNTTPGWRRSRQRAVKSAPCCRVSSAQSNGRRDLSAQSSAERTRISCWKESR